MPCLGVQPTVDCRSTTSRSLRKGRIWTLRWASALVATRGRCWTLPRLERLLAPCCPQRTPKKGRRRCRRPQLLRGAEVIEALPTSGRARPAGAFRSKKTRARGCEIILLNSSGKPQLLAAMQSDPNAAVTINQEHHCFGPEFVDLQHDAKNEGWSLVGSFANRTSKHCTSVWGCYCCQTRGQHWSRCRILRPLE